MISIWIILGIITVILLIIFWNKKGATWGGFTIGTIVGFIATIVYLFKGNEFIWAFIGKGAVLGTITGFFAELLGKISDSIKKKV